MESQLRAKKWKKKVASSGIRTPRDSDFHQCSMIKLSKIQTSKLNISETTDYFFIKNDVFLTVFVLTLIESLKIYVKKNCWRQDANPERIPFSPRLSDLAR